jgi:hypothetical protein
MLMADIHPIRRSLRCTSGMRAAVVCVLWGIGFVAHSQESPAPPVPHARPDLPGTHVQPDPVLKESVIALHVDGPLVVEQKRCTKDSFEIKYTVANHSAAPANGTILATLNGTGLTPVGSAKLTELQPGKAISGAFTACCPANGLFPLRLEFRGDAGQKATERVSIAADPVNISCK